MRLICNLLNRVVSGTSKNSVRNTVVLKNVPWLSGTKEIKLALKKYGEIKSVYLPVFSKYVTHSGIAEVTFENSDSVEKAFNAERISIDGINVYIYKKNRK